MSEHITILKVPPAPTQERIAFSNSIRLDARQWLALGLFAVVFAVALPPIWKYLEDFKPTTDYRVPRDLSNDYWFYENYVDEAVQTYDVQVVGDSVIWGEFVTRDHTLTHYLNQQVRKERFVNLGVNGVHPLAFEGLIYNYAPAISGKNVLLHCNLTWLRESKTDLQDPDATVNHPRLVPQFVGKPPAYKAEISDRLGVLVERRVALLKWTSHLQQAYYRTDQPNDIPSWTLKHPYDNPLAPLARPLPASDDKPHADARPWKKRLLSAEDITWVDMDKSLQWPAFQRTVETLKSRGNRVVVLVGPFNEHMLTPASKGRYAKVKGTITAWLTANDVPHLAPAVLPTDLYADVSHPLAAGYELLAKQMLEDRAFRDWMK